jgi:undecaprenyl diphosphate synthase
MPAVFPMRAKRSPQDAAVSDKKSDATFLREIDRTRIPKHIAVIMDGNGRWARQRHLPRIFGHQAGVSSVRDIVQAAGELGVKVLTLYAFSAENWTRPATEVDALMRLLEKYLVKELPELQRKQVRLGAIGRWNDLPKTARGRLQGVIDQTSANKGLVLNLALNYGGRQEIVDACNRAWEDGVKVVNEKVLSKYLYAPEAPDPDLLIRTSGEMRLSNFLLWQMAYTELHITPVLWPDFRRRDLYSAVLDYQGRERRFGGL